MVTLLLIAVVLAVAPANAQQRQPRDPVRKPDSARVTTSISGRVTDAETGRPLADAIVMAVSVAFAVKGEVRPFVGVTDQLGHYTIAGLAPGDYVMRATPSPYRGTHRDAAPGGFSGLAIANAPPVTLAAGDQLGGVDFALPRAYAIEGIVLNEDGRAMVHLDVRAERIDAPGGPARSVYSDDRGTFRIFGLGPGVYRVCAEPLSRVPAPDMPGGDGRQYVRTCSPLLPDASAPGAIRITASDVAGAVLRVSRSGTFTMAGQVIDSTGAFVQDAHVAMWRQDGPGRTAAAAVETSEGRFIARSLVPGEYRVRAELSARPDRAAQVGITPVRVEGSDVSGVTVVLAPGAEIRGVVQLEGGTLAPDARARLRIWGRPPVGAQPLSGETASTAVADDLSFVLRPLFGPNLIDVQNLPEGWALKSISLLGRDITHRETTFTTSQEPAALRIVLSNRTARMTVRTFDASGAPAVRLIAVIPVDAERRRGGIRRIGRYTAPGVHDFGWFVPGEYLVISSLADGPLATRPDRIDLDELAKTAVRVTLAAGEDRVVDIRLPGGGQP